MRAYRGMILNPRGENHCALYPDGLLVVNDAGQVAAIGATDTVARRFGDGALEIVESTSPPIILPAFTDAHLHWVQNRIRGSAHGQGVLAWLNESVWPEEAKFSQSSYAKENAIQFFRDIGSHGTLTGAVYSSIHEIAMEAFAPPFGHFFAGNVLMSENAPAQLRQTADEAIDITARWAGKPGSDAKTASCAYAVSPRFAPMCSMETLERAARIAQRHKCLVQTHLAENLEEVAWARKQFPDCQSYAGVYHRAGLLGPRTILGHCIYLDDDELATIKAADAAIAHCPTSNESLGSGRMPIERVRKAGIRWALASDIGAGPSLSMWEVMKTFLRVHAVAGLRFNASEVLYRATLAGAEILGLSDRCGNLDLGKEANFLLLDAPELLHPQDANEALGVLLSQENFRLPECMRGAYFRGNLCPVAGN